MVWRGGNHTVVLIFRANCLLMSNPPPTDFFTKPKESQLGTTVVLGFGQNIRTIYKLGLPVGCAPTTSHECRFVWGTFWFATRDFPWNLMFRPEWHYTPRYQWAVIAKMENQWCLYILTEVWRLTTTCTMTTGADVHGLYCFFEHPAGSSLRLRRWTVSNGMISASCWSAGISGIPLP
jgi:hypothetical protein